MIEVAGEGPCPAKIFLVGEAPGQEEERIGRPFVGPSGLELNRMLEEVGLHRSEVFLSNVCRLRPLNNDISVHISRTRKCPASDMKAFRNGWATERIHDGFAKLKREIEIVKPNLIVAFGNLALWALSGRWGIGDWRGSELRTDIFPENNPKLIPTYHPAAILRQWSWRPALLADLRRAALNAGSRDYSLSNWRFRIRPSFEQAAHWLSELGRLLDAASELRISFDLETRNQHIACAGFATSSSDAFCIPFMVVDRTDELWSESEEAVLVRLIQRILTHPRARIVGQNLLYDAQYTWRWWHCVPRVSMDTMIAWHTCFAELPKALQFQASMVCERFVAWKGMVSHDPLKKDA